MSDCNNKTLVTDTKNGKTFSATTEIQREGSYIIKVIELMDTVTTYIRLVDVRHSEDYPSVTERKAIIASKYGDKWIMCGKVVTHSCGMHGHTTPALDQAIGHAIDMGIISKFYEVRF